MAHASSAFDAMPGSGALDSLAPAMPNKHIPVCPPGPPRSGSPQDDVGFDADVDGVYETGSSTSKDNSSSSGTSHSASTSSLSSDTTVPLSVLYPPVGFARLKPSRYGLAHSSPFVVTPADVAAAVDHTARHPLPDPSLVFPWLHGVHPQNRIQQSYLLGRHRSLRGAPTSFRGITIVKADGDLTVSRLKGAVGWTEILDAVEPRFLDMDPKDGFSVRNFHIQVAKTAVISDIIIYGEDKDLVHSLAWDTTLAQHKWCLKQAEHGYVMPEYNTFVCVGPFAEFEMNHPDLVAVDSTGTHTGQVLDFFLQERKEMYAMTTASEISPNVWLGPTPDPNTDDDEAYDVLIECSDNGTLDPNKLRLIAERPGATLNQHFVDIPSSGSLRLPPPWCQSEPDDVLATCKWLYAIANGVHPRSPDFFVPRDEDADVTMTEDGPSLERPVVPEVRPRRVLIHCPDGYTESTLFAVAYHSYSTGMPVHDAWLDLHKNLGRSCFAYAGDVALLRFLAPRLVAESPRCGRKSLSEITAMVQDTPPWWDAFDGSFPSKVLDYMYLGNLKHADNPRLLRAVGIGQILSVGETATWSAEDAEVWGADNVCTVADVQDNGIDTLTGEFQRCLDFIDRGRRNGTATLVHCRVGVSRSATICIAEVMRARGVSFPRAYCFVRARRLNVIIQPHVRFAYELLKWEELLHHQSRKDGAEGRPYKRELEWCEVAREIARMNRPYAH
jgi:dual specificity MAP kinase phosphatase